MATEPNFPPLFRRHVRRPRLTRIIDDSVAQCVIVTGPAGYGKTTLAREWSQGRDDVVWCRATASSADIAAFSTAVADAIAELVPGAGERLRQRLQVAEAPEKSARPLAELLAADIAGWPRGAWLIVDDYHLVIDSTPVEEFVDWLLTLSRLRLLVTTRWRPSWASARRALHGELTEIGQQQLAMTDDEARDVLGERSNEAVRALVAQAEGWPAVIGLAALANSSELPSDHISDALFRYFAEEVFRQETIAVQDFMLLASVPVTLDSRVAREVLDVEDPEPLLGELCAKGLLHSSGSHDLHFQPLVREFLRHKLEATKPEIVKSLTERAIVSTRDVERWDEAFDLAITMGDQTTAAQITAEAGPSLLASGRLETLENWMEGCGARVVADPGALLVKASVLLRRGRLSEAAVLAAEQASCLPPDDVNTSRGWYLAGQARHLLSDYAEAFRSHKRASATATTIEARKDALWGLFLTSIEQEDASAHGYLRDYKALDPHSLDDRLRLATGRLVAAMRTPLITSAWEEAKPLLSLQTHSRDPMIRSSYATFCAYACCARGYYSEARLFGHAAFEYCQALGLSFATGHCLCHLACAAIGLRDFAAARRALHRLVSLLDETSEPFLSVTQQALTLRLEVAGKGSRIAFEHFKRPLGNGLPQAPLAETLSLASLAAVGAGRYETARALAQEAQQSTNSIETYYYSRFAIALADWLERPEEASSEALLGLIRITIDSGFSDALVMSYRAAPRLVTLFAQCGALTPEIRNIMLRANDTELAVVGEVPMTPREERASRSMAGLTRRESEVLHLVARGLSNREISTELFISPSTTKVHMRNVLKKLQVSTRLQAVLKLHELSEE
jgi:LuxR family maltose regulon positive regulatory protein